MLFFPNNSVITFLEGCFPCSLWQKLTFPSPFCYSNDLSSILSFGGIVMLLFSLIISNCEDHVLFVLIHLTGVSCPLFKFFSSYPVLHLFSTRVLSKFVLPCSLFISFQPEWFNPFLSIVLVIHSFATSKVQMVFLVSIFYRSALNCIQLRCVLSFKFSTSQGSLVSLFCRRSNLV